MNNDQTSYLHHIQEQKEQFNMYPDVTYVRDKRIRKWGCAKAPKTPLFVLCACNTESILIDLKATDNVVQLSILFAALT